MVVSALDTGQLWSCFLSLKRTNEPEVRTWATLAGKISGSKVDSATIEDGLGSPWAHPAVVG